MLGKNWMGRTETRGSVWEWEVPPGSLGMWMISSVILLVGLGGGSMGRASFVVERGIWRTFIVLEWRKIQLHKRKVHLLLPDVGLWGISLMVPVL